MPAPRPDARAARWWWAAVSAAAARDRLESFAEHPAVERGLAARDRTAVLASLCDA